MRAREWRNIDKVRWGRGPWQDEPDKVQWNDVATGMPCLAVRHPGSGHWCGYVGVADKHPFHGISYDGCPTPGTCPVVAKQAADPDGYHSCYEHSPSGACEVHGGLTFAAARQPGEDEGRGICHVAESGEPDRVWWFGFDCAHSGDTSPAYDRPSLGRHDSYKTLGYVQSQCTQLARQLAEIAPAP